MIAMRVIQLAPKEKYRLKKSIDSSKTDSAKAEIWRIGPLLSRAIRSRRMDHGTENVPCLNSVFERLGGVQNPGERSKSLCMSKMPLMSTQLSEHLVRS
jgi:hypothetical protein